jgi:hypothetical protein
MRIVAYVVVANYAAIVLVYLTLGNYFDHIEPGLASVAWLVAQGAPMYPAPESAQQYGYLYGPLQFLLNAAVMRLLGPSILTSKLASAVLALVAALALYGAIRKDRSHECALIGTALLVLELFVAWPFTVVIARTDALMMGVVGLGLLGAVLRPGWVATALVGVSLGVAMNFKAHSGLYFLPALYVLWERNGNATVIGALALAGVALASPFMLARTVSLSGYLNWLEIASQHGLMLGAFLARLRQLLGYVILPAMSVLLVVDEPWRQVLRWRRFLVVLAVATLAVTVVSSHWGSSKNHLMPLMIPWSYWAAHVLYDGFAWRALWARSDRAAWWRTRLALVVLTIMVLTIIPVNLRLGRLVAEDMEYDVAADLRQIMDDHPGAAIGIGHGQLDHKLLAWYRPLLVFEGHPYLLDESTVTDLQAAGRELPPATLRALQDCVVDIWLIPRGDRPFEVSTALGFPQMFSLEFREMFQARHDQRESSRYYDLWFCEREGVDGAGPAPRPIPRGAAPG